MGNRSLIASLVTLAMGLTPAVGHTAGLGKLTILSAIGQPLVGEIDLVSVRKEEVSTLAARIAPPGAYKNANINFNAALVGARATVEKRPNGALYIRVTSTRPVDEPYLDLLVELSWNTGRLMREYTALVDPPGFGPAQTAAPVVVPATKPAPATPLTPSSPTATASPAPAGAPSAQTYGPVQQGDTLRKIASGVRPQGVSLDQMLVAIFRSNPDAFINNNMNLLRSGRILKIPQGADLTAVSPAEADREIRLQANDWNAYRERAAGAAPQIPSGDVRTAAGKITTKVDDPGAAPESSKDVVRVSKGAPAKPGTGTGEKELQERIRSLEEEATAREKTLKDSGDRIAALEKTIKDMQRLLELKGVAVPAPPSPVAEAKPAIEPPAPKPEVAPAPPVAESKPEAVPPKPAPEPPKAEEKKAASPPPPPPAPVEEPWYSDPMVLGGGLLALGLIGGGAYVASRRRKQVVAPDEPEAEPTFKMPAPPVADPTPTATGPGGFTAAMAGATMQMPAMQTAAAPVDDVDPIAEADVYIAYGRDAQAEEILKEALAKDPSRDEIKLKLLEIYAARKSKSDFNPLASQVHAAKGGAGDTWLRVATMGYALDPDNALYAAGKDSSIQSPIGAATDVNLDFDLDMVSSAGAPATVTDVPLDAGDPNVKTMILSPATMDALKAETAALAAKAASTQNVVPDLDLSTTALQAPNTDVNLQPMVPAGPETDLNLDLPAPAGTDSNVIDFEFDPSKTMRIEPEVAAAFAPEQTIALTPENQEKARDLGIEIDLSALDGPTQVQPSPSAEPPIADQTAEISFDFQLPSDLPPPSVVPPAADVTSEVPATDITFEVPEVTPPAKPGAMDFALETVSLDLGDMKAASESPAPVHDDHWMDIQTKFDLAKAYEEMGDKDGAREILQEVIKEGDAQQQAEATTLLAKLG